jgi:hypothetical protein
MVIFFGMWYLFFTWIKKQMLSEDLESVVTTSHWLKARSLSAWFLLFFRGEFIRIGVGLDYEHRHALVQHHVRVVHVCQLVGNSTGSDHADRGELA